MNPNKDKRKKSLIGWVCTENPLMRYDGNHNFAELAIAPVYKTKKGVYFHEHFTKRSRYLFSPKKVRITIEELQ